MLCTTVSWHTFYNWKRVLFDPFHPFHWQSPHPMSHFRQPPICSPYQWDFFVVVVCFDSLCKWDCMVFIFFYLTYFTQHSALQVFSCCQKWHNFSYFNDWVIFHLSLSHTHTHTHTHTRHIYTCVPIYMYTHIYTNIPHFLYPFIINGHLVFYVLAIINNATVNMEVHISFQIGVFIYFEQIQKWSCWS